MSSSDDNAEEIARLRLGDPATWERLQSTIRQVVLPRVPGARALDGEEVLTDITTALWLSLGSLRDGTKLLAFTATIARRIVRRKIEGLRRHVPLAFEPRERGDGSASQRLEDREMLEHIAGSLKTADWALFQLLYLSGASNEEIQKTLSVSPAMLRQRKHRLRRRIRRGKGPKSPGGDPPS